MNLTITFDSDANKFYALVENRECAVEFRSVDDDAWEYYNTYVPLELRGRGIAASLVAYALQYAREHGKKVIPACSYVREYIERHPQWSDIVR